MAAITRLRRQVGHLPDGLVDAALAGALLTIELSIFVLVRPGDIDTIPLYEGPSALHVVTIVLVTLPVAWRRRWPFAGLLIALGFGTAGFLAGMPLQGLSVIVLLYSVASSCDRRRSATALALCIAVLVASFAAVGALRFLPVNTVIFVTAWVLGDRQRTRRAYTAELEEKARRLEAERAAAAERAVAEERRRIARELHDVVAHSLSVMVVQAAAARRTLERDPARVAATLEQVEATGRQSLAEMRRLLGVMRTDEEDAAELAPQPGLAALRDLIAQFREVGVDVDLRLDDDLDGSLPSSVELSAYRIVQEALVNVLKHAGPAKVRVSVRREAEGLRVDVVDDGRGALPDSADRAQQGHGLIGMRERAALVGGTVAAGPRAGGGFEVAAELPTRG